MRFPTWSNLALENELKGVDWLLGMSSLAPLYSYPSGCLHGILKAAPVPAGFRDLPVTSEGLPRAEEGRSTSKTFQSVSCFSFHYLLLFSDLYNLTSQIKIRLKTNNLCSLSDTIYYAWIKTPTHMFCSIEMTYR